MKKHFMRLIVLEMKVGDETKVFSIHTLSRTEELTIPEGAKELCRVTHESDRSGAVWWICESRARLELLRLNKLFPPEFGRLTPSP